MLCRWWRSDLSDDMHSNLDQAKHGMMRNSQAWRLLRLPLLRGILMTILTVVRREYVYYTRIPSATVIATQQSRRKLMLHR
jgi:hypothetical protein